MKYLLDTNVLISLYKNTHGIREKILDVGRTNCFISDITIGELLVGAYKGRNKRQWDEVQMTKGLFVQIPVSQDVIERYAKERVNLESLGCRIDDLDLLIGCTALQHELTIVTHNRKHFERIPNIIIEDWDND